MHKFVILRIYSIRPHIAVIYRHKNSQPPAGAKVGLCQYSFSARILNIWNSLTNTVVDVDSVCLSKARLDKFWMHQPVKYDFTADLTGIGDKSVHDISIL